MKGFTEGRWNGVVNYRCNYCSFAAPGKNGLQRIKSHVSGHFMNNDVPEVQEEETAVLGFDSDEAADTFIDLPEDVREYLTEIFLESTPSGANGFTMTDINDALGAMINEKE